MDKIIFWIGILTVIVGLLIIYKSFNQTNLPESNQRKLLCDEVDLLLPKLKMINNSNITEYNSNLKDKALDLKRKLEQILGINCVSEVGIRDYQNVVNKFGIERITSDLESLREQLSNK